MNKAELVQAMADDAGLSKSDAEKALNAFVEIVGGELGKGGKVQLVGFGTFEVTERAARVGKNPQNGKEISIPACKAPRYKENSGRTATIGGVAADCKSVPSW